jgi:hypothetical protein
MTQTTPSLGQIAFEKHIGFNDFSIPRLGQRMATWYELPEKCREEWEEVANAVLAAANAEVVDDLRI